jgi:hypothetical protein
LPHQVTEEDFQEKGSWFLLHNNASAPSAMTAKRLLKMCKVMEISHPLLST